MDTVSVQIPAGVFATVAALVDSSNIRLSIVRIETSACFLYPDDITSNFEIAAILAISFEEKTLQNLSTSDEIIITFDKAQVGLELCCLYIKCQVCCVGLFWAAYDLSFPIHVDGFEDKMRLL